MPNDRSVVADPANGMVVVAGRRVAMRAAANGHVRFAGSIVMRPLTFGERTDLVVSAAGLPSARDSVAAAILGAARVDGSAGETPLFEVLAMWLAGAEWDAPDFIETTLLVAGAAGWPPQELFNAPAREIDRIAVHLDEQRRASGWKTLLFAEPPAESIDQVRASFADQLLRRSRGGPDTRIAQTQTTSVPSEAAPAPERVASTTSAFRLLRVDGVLPPSGARVPQAAERSGPGANGAPLTWPFEASSPRSEPPTDAFSPRSREKGHVLAAVAPVQPSTEGVPRAGQGLTPGAIRSSPLRAESLEGTSSMRGGARIHSPTAASAAAVAPFPAGAESARPPGDGLPLPASAVRSEPVNGALSPRIAETAAVLPLPGRGEPLLSEPIDLAASLAAMLDDEADLRGVER